MDKTANRRFSVLVIDDEPQVTSELSELLENSGYHCVVSDSKDSALQKFRDDPSIGLVICDLGLGRDNGIRVVEALKEAAGTARFFETIILTGQQGSQEVIEAMRVGVADYYQKPVAPMDLLKGLERLEARLHERIRSQLSLSHVNQRLEYLAESLNSISRDIHKIKYEVHGGGQPAGGGALKQEQTEPAASAAPNNAEQIAPVVNNPLFNKLSPRQQAVARLVSKGLTNYQIAYDLGITENTVKLYVSQVLRLMHMHNRTQLALAISPSASQSSAVH
ncbi:MULTISPECIES: response regulator transcription factor [Pseudomonas]|uniref:Response regulator transcription factor n=1 Tax=Pseudomonas nitroreducens TaxID=46680 RepID=A0A6G6ISG0_PSENT|nr:MULTISPECIES: response regulator transcription factor [Pseudomonas]MBG6287396.1 response regulator transcription factor [Pseudomonas nitroreducens]NMZ61717.1 response regulator transcription factor [Pseudomonas nitroreducens]OBY60579.1 DNA-binding response regulator [Pseudomonas sp. AU12215]QIE85907.1 response regulator transcription factor [Pseudomonas nitroreducens]SNT17294.1 two component transcriptional regulator, LuxR family [Pseudomonas nitroreducens]